MTAMKIETLSNGQKILRRKPCMATAGGYVCARDANHGELHHDTEHKTLWILKARTEGERRGIFPPSGYELITDKIIEVFFP